MTTLTNHTATTPAADGQVDRHALLERYNTVRRFTETLCEPLSIEDYVVQSMPDASPVKWHLAHTTWFFEIFLLQKFVARYEPFHHDFTYLFNSYYNMVGPQHARPNRGLITRPTVADVRSYRAAIDEAVHDAIEALADEQMREVAEIIEIGINHEQQHQELIVTDLKHLFSCNPLMPTYREAPIKTDSNAPGDVRWRRFSEGVYEIGHDGSGFAYDNESPCHRVFLHDFQIADRLITAGEYMQFMEDGGYERANLWLDLGWQTVNQRNWMAPEYWFRRDGTWHLFTLNGLRPVDPNEPVCHVSFFEAEAFARWAGARLPWESEWEIACRATPIEGTFADAMRFHPAPVNGNNPNQIKQAFGEVWQWTASQYLPYPGYRPPAGALGEYNGKFMCNQFVLRGASCATPKSHARLTYRNFFPPAARWQFSGIRLAKDA